MLLLNIIYMKFVFYNYYSLDAYKISIIYDLE